MQFLLMHPYIAGADAISRDVLEMYRLFSGLHQCFVFCESNAGLEGVRFVDWNQAIGLAKSGECAVLYHHSEHWAAGEEVLSAAKGPIIFKLHSILPPRYYAPSPHGWQANLAGWEQTYRFVRRFPRAVWLTDSLLTLHELGIDEGLSFRVIPPFLTADAIDACPDETTIRRLMQDGRLQVLSVGRFAPNEDHLFLLKVLDSFRIAYGHNIVWHIVGRRNGFMPDYFEGIVALSRDLGLSGMIDFVGEVNASQSVAYFLGCDLYLSCSEYEGFSAPIVESQCLCLPVIARTRPGLRETGECGLFLAPGDDPQAFAAQLNELRDNPALRQEMIERGRRNYLERFTNQGIGEQLLAALRDFGIPV